MFKRLVLFNMSLASSTDSLFQPQTVSVRHIQSMSVTDSLCLSQIVFVGHRKVVSITDSLCLSRKVCVCHRESLSVTLSLCVVTVVTCQPVSAERCVVSRKRDFSFVKFCSQS